LKDLTAEGQDKLISHLGEICFVYCSPANVSTIRELKEKGYEDTSEEIIALENSKYYSYQVNSGCELGWIVTTNINSAGRASLELALIVTGAKELDDDTYNFLVTNKYKVSYVDPDTERIVTNLVTADAEARSFIGYPIYNQDGSVTWENILTVGGQASRFLGTREVSNGDYDNNGSTRPPTP